ncbi:ATP-binding protein [Trinickia caryophylli]|uniref:histidine kinase n=1 Tax=Trinickia caryophylli TaxID=28094 RepID=A0A1X7CZM7_TRICW|nr:ATP-binding protein [Trinickia caryophylli]PMS13525.1 two-component sensor histidine kinase [Trinickia caryophylli]TRX13616.1 two-component sensor histidine kinase [Trinickia caryophylli]WQE15194.1 ATP-binding protein [Trinickia caryophylli]SMF06024.1 two-component system, OmpR family, sensor histidine kinase QseC [Trinickia caryophylli]GLU31067.1 two-component sensor histidine kinase [Trinickia caryophylli]
MTFSIRRRLVVLTLLSVALVWIVTFATSYRQATHEANEWQDARLEQAAQMLLLLDAADLKTLAANGTLDADGDRAEHEGPPLLFEVRTMDGTLVAVSAGLKPTEVEEALASSPETKPHASPRGKWRVMALRDASRNRRVRVFEHAKHRGDLVKGVAHRIARPLAFALPLLAVLLWFSIGSSLAPLKALSAAIGARDADNLEPLDLERTPTEARTLLDALNGLFARVRKSLDRERAFTADAAHELKSPLAAIKVQAQVALAAQDPDVKALAMRRVVEGVDRSTHLADELLLLARIDEAVLAPLERVDLHAVARQCLTVRETDAQRKHLTMTLHPGEPVAIYSDAELIRVMLDNLLDNAIKYGRPGGRVEVDVSRTAGSASLAVRDDGPGVAPADRARLGDRFFRVVGTGQRGSGLGLSIVARIAARFGATVRYTEGIGGCGLGVTIDLPATAAEHEPRQMPSGKPPAPATQA